VLNALEIKRTWLFNIEMVKKIFLKKGVMMGSFGRMDDQIRF
jgi:hypothetical protein